MITLRGDKTVVPMALSAAKRERIREAFDYAAQPKESVDRCNLCGWGISLGGGTFAKRSIEAEEDRYGFPQWADRCGDCGLVFLHPRMTAAAYRQFYESGAYRRILSAFYGREMNTRLIRAQQRAYSQGVANFMAPHVQALRLAGKRPATLLDIGGSTGLVAKKLARRFEVTPTVLDPAVDELALADGERIVSTAEDFQPGARRWDLVTLCQTIDHLLDIAGTLRKVRECLSEHGLFFVDIVDYNVRREVKIDHPFNLTKRTMAEYLKRAGFKVLATERAWDVAHVRYLCAR